MELVKIVKLTDTVLVEDVVRLHHFPSTIARNCNRPGPSPENIEVDRRFNRALAFLFQFSAPRLLPSLLLDVRVLDFHPVTFSHSRGFVVGLYFGDIPCVILSVRLGTW